MHFLGFILLVVVVYWIASRATGSRGVGVGAAALTGVAVLMISSHNQSHHNHCCDYDRLT